MSSTLSVCAPSSLSPASTKDAYSFELEAFDLKSCTIIFFS